METLEKVNEGISKKELDQFVTFSLEGEEYGVEILKVQEIIGYPGCTKVPNMPLFVKGVISLRGSVVPVIDLRLKFHMQEKDCDKFTVVLILEVKERIIGAIVDAVEDVIALSKEEMQETPNFSSEVKADFIKAIGRRDGKLIILLDIDRVISEVELGMLEVA